MKGSCKGTWPGLTSSLSSLQASGRQHSDRYWMCMCVGDCWSVPMWWEYRCDKNGVHVHKFFVVCWFVCFLSFFSVKVGIITLERIHYLALSERKSCSKFCKKIKKSAMNKICSHVVLAYIYLILGKCVPFIVLEWASRSSCLQCTHRCTENYFWITWITWSNHGFRELSLPPWIVCHGHCCSSNYWLCC